MSERPSFADVRAARERLAGVARVTPVFSSDTLSRLAGRPVVLKAENLQRTGAFKIRGAYNTIAQLSDEERAAGVFTASAGNHGQAVAWAAREAGIPATILVPEAAPMAKVEAARGYGARVELAGEGFDESAALAHERAAEARRDLRAPVRGRARDRRPGHVGPRAGGAAARRPGDRRDPGRRRRAGRRGRARAPRAAAGAAAGRCSGRRLRAARGAGSHRRHDRGRDRGQASGGAHRIDARRAARRRRRGRRRGDLRGDRAPARALEARCRGRGGGTRGRDPLGPRRWGRRRVRCRCRRERRRDDAELGRAIRPDGLGAATSSSRC